MARPARSSPPPRISFLLASEAPIGIVFRRGPTKLVRIYSWDRERDKFKPGSWFKGRIFPKRSALSPDGRYMIYFAMGAVAWAIPATGGTWTAISRVPSLTAIALWGQGGETWGGGGRFTCNTRYWLDANANTFLLRDTQLLRRDSLRPVPDWSVERQGLGWTSTKGRRDGWTLRQSVRYPKKDRFTLEREGAVIELPGCEWADWDRDRLVWAESGCLRAAKVRAGKLVAVRTLYDFNSAS